MQTRHEHRTALWPQIQSHLNQLWHSNFDQISVCFFENFHEAPTFRLFVIDKVPVQIQLFKLAQLTILQAGFEKNSILYINPDFWVPLRNFFLNLGALSIKHARGFKVSTLIFLKILPLFDQKIAKYGLKNAFWSWKQQLWTVDFNITKIHGVSPLHLYSNVYIGFFLLLNIYEGVRVLYVCVRLAYFWKVCEACFSTFFQKFLGWL